MNRRHFLTTTTGTAMVTLTGQSSAQQEQPGKADDGWPDRETLNKLFRQYSEFFRSHLSERYQTLPREIGGDDWIIGRGGDAEKDIDQAGEPTLVVRSPLVDLSVFFYIQVTRAGQVIRAETGVYEFPPRYKDPKIFPKPPAARWELAEAVRRVQSTLKEIGWEVPSDMRLGNVSDRYGVGAWYAEWNRTFDGLPEVESNAAPDKISVWIYESGEGASFIRWRRGPVPKSTAPKLTRSEAMEIAVKALPDFLAPNTWTSHSILTQNLKEPELRKFKGTDLCVTSPNWVMDPKRFKLSIGYPRERRLCWRSRFLFQGQPDVPEKEGFPEAERKGFLLEVHVDALTGEVIGGQIAMPTI